MLRRLLQITLLAGALLALTAGPSAAAAPCWKTLINDWYDGTIDNTYPIPCYHEAIAHLPADVQTYSAAAEDINRALQQAIERQKHPGQTTPTSTNGAGGGPGKNPNGKGPGGIVTTAFHEGTSKATSVPIPLIVLAAVAVLLLLAGTAGFVARRMQARRVPVRVTASPPQSHPQP